MRYTLIVTALLLFSITLKAQSKFDGSWQGKLSSGGQSVKVIMNIATKGGSTNVSLDVPQQGATGIKSSETAIKDDSITIRYEQAKVTYVGVYKNAENIDGKWKQGGLSFPLKLKKMDKPFKFDRPQEPKPKFNYNSEDVAYTNADKSVQFGATITYS